MYGTVMVHAWSSQMSFSQGALYLIGYSRIILALLPLEVDSSYAYAYFVTGK